jgi:hypothetical protein
MEDHFEDGVEDGKATVAVDFDNVFPGVGVRPPHGAQKDLVHQGAYGRVAYPSMVEAVGFGEALRLRRLKELAGDGKSVCSAYFDDPDPSLADGSADGADRIVNKSCFHHAIRFGSLDTDSQHPSRPSPSEAEDVLSILT